MKKPFILLFFILLCLFESQAQLFDSISIGNINARIWNNGLFFWDTINKPKFEYPKGSGKHVNFATSIWMSGIDVAGQLRITAQDYNQNGRDFWSGPMLIGNGNYSAIYDQKYNRVWKVSKSEIDNHIANYQNTGYITPQHILDWPGNGDVLNGEPAQIAPYFDANNDQLYTPNLGDYPLIKGDEAIYCILNDYRGLHTASGGLYTGVEIHILFYAFDAINSPELNNTLFASILLKCRGPQLQDFYFGIFEDPDLGSYIDDYVGCDTLNNLFYWYNSDNIDGDYGVAPPAAGLKYLNPAMSNFIYYHNDNDPSIGNPTIGFHYSNYLRSVWKDGTHLVANGLNGYAGTAPGPNTNYMFTGIPETNQGWIEFGINSPGDRRGLSATRLGDLLTGQAVCVDLAWIVAHDSSNLASIAKLRNHAQFIQNYFTANGLACAAQTTVSIDNDMIENRVSISPNPLNTNQLMIFGVKGSYRVYIYDIQGKNIFESSGYAKDEKISIIIPQNIKNGLYYISVRNGSGNVSHQKLIIQN